MPTPAPTAAPTPELSLVVPVLDEAENIRPFLEAIAAEVKTAESLEVLFVDDGSTDGTLAEIEAARLAAPFPVELVSFSRNFGKEAATTAGLDHARGRAVVPIDVDLQDPPEVIDRMLERWRAGDEMVLGLRRDRGEDSLPKRWSALLFYGVAGRISETAIPANAGDFRLMDRRVVEAVRHLREKNRFMKGLLSWPGFRVGVVEYDRPARARGTTKWRVWKLMGFAADGLFGFSTLPLRIWTWLGLATSALAFLYMAYTVAKTLLLGVDVPGYASLLSVTLMLNGLALLGIGVVGEYVGRIFNEVKDRPIYVVRRATLPPAGALSGAVSVAGPERREAAE